MFRSLFSSTNYCMDVVSGTILLFSILPPVVTNIKRTFFIMTFLIPFILAVNCRHEWGVRDWSVPQIGRAEQRQHILCATCWRTLGPHSLCLGLPMHSGDGQEYDGNSCLPPQLLLSALTDSTIIIFSTPSHLLSPFVLRQLHTSLSPICLSTLAWGMSWLLISTERCTTLALTSARKILVTSSEWLWSFTTVYIPDY